MSATVDFDAAWRELVGEPPTVKAFGQVVVLPPDMPAAVPLHLERMRIAEADPDDDVEDATIWQLLAMVVGQQQVDEWVDVHRMGARQGMFMLGTIFRAYRERDAGTSDADPEPPAPATGPKPAKRAAKKRAASSRRGAPSKPTGSASTARTSRKR